ncbi:hypothetical protein SNEBB_008591 [Seison nebaliae]|nr:hypothetical protein SNEBB_008591 [Seison nebaliae]
MVVISIPEIAHSINSIKENYLGVKISKSRYYLYPVQKCVKKKYYPIRITSSSKKWCINNFQSSRILSDLSMSKLNCSFQYFKTWKDIQLVGECYGSTSLDSIIGLIDGKVMKASPRYLEKPQIISRPRIRDLVAYIVQRREEKAIERINSENLKKIRNAMTKAKSAFIISITACSLTVLMTTLITITMLSVKLGKSKRNKVSRKSERKDSIGPAKLNVN